MSTLAGIGAPADMGLEPRRWPRPDAASLRQLYVEEGLTVAALAARFGVAAQTAHNWLVAAGVARRVSPASARADVSDVEVRRLYELEGGTAAEVAARLGCATSTVYARLQRLGVPRRPARPRRSSRPAHTELGRLYLERGLSLRRLAERFSVSPQAVRAWLDASGVPRRGHEGRTSPRQLRRCGGAVRPRLVGPAHRDPLQLLDGHRVPPPGGRRGGPPGPASCRRRAGLIEALDAGLSARDIAARFKVSVSAVCRALTREGLSTLWQTKRRQAAEHYATLLTLAEGSGGADGATVEWLRRRVRSAPGRPGSD